MNNLIIAKNYETFGDAGLTSNKVIYYKEDNMVKFRANITDNPYGESEVVTVGGGSVEPKDYNEQYFTLEALEDGLISFTSKITGEDSKLQYSKNGSNWTNGNSIEVSVGDKVRFKAQGMNPKIDRKGGIGTFTGKFKAYGNILSLLFGDNFINPTITNEMDYYYAELFRGSNLVDAENLIMPSVVNQYCYSGMFRECTLLTVAPKLPATVMALHCYNNMFNGCTSLIEAPNLPATTLADYCYTYMFTSTNLKEGPELPVTTLAAGCYEGMFSNCFLLEVAPVLPAPTYVTRCYNGMFEYCTSLRYVKCLCTNKIGNATFVRLSGIEGAIFIEAETADQSSVVPSNYRIYKESDEMPLYQADSYDMVATFEDDTTLTTKIYVKQ